MPRPLRKRLKPALPARPAVRVLLVVALLLLASCVEQRQVQTRENSALPGISVKGIVERHNERFHLDAVATHAGNQTVWVRSVCEPPWVLELRDPQGVSFSPQEPLAHCQAIAWEPFEPGQHQSYKAWWNQTRWDPDRSETVPAPPGTHHWLVRFRAALQEGQAEHAIELDFELRVS